jgi:hypothetical protein
VASVTGRLLVGEREGEAVTLTPDRRQHRDALSLWLVGQLIGVADTLDVDPAVVSNYWR